MLDEDANICDSSQESEEDATPLGSIEFSAIKYRLEQQDRMYNHF